MIVRPYVESAQTIFSELPIEEQIAIIQRRVDVYNKYVNGLKKANERVQKPTTSK